MRKKLDGLLYAIKRINLNPKSAQLKKRIIREVKLLSRLNHENVVRSVLCLGLLSYSFPVSSWVKICVCSFHL